MEKKRIIKNKNWIFFFMIYIIGIIIMHFFMEMNTGDDQVSKELTRGYSMFGWMKYRYFNWSARFIQEGWGYFIIWHPILWKVLDSLILISIPLIYMNLINANEIEKYFCCFVFLLYPIIDMSSAGWICTTNTYLWPVFFALLAFTIVKKEICNNTLRWYDYLIFFISLIVANDHELLAVIMFCLLLYNLLCYGVAKKRCSLLLLFGLLLNIGKIVLILISPGNKSRLAAETNTWFPGFYDLSLVDKLYLGVVRVFNVLIIQKNILFIVFCILILAAVFFSCKGKLKVAIAAIPICLVAVLQTQLASFQIGDIYEIDWGKISTYVPLVISCIILACITCSLLWVYRSKEDKYKCYLFIIVLYIGLSTTVVMGFSPTIYVSGSRTSTFMYFSLISICIFLFNKVSSKFEKYKDSVEIIVIVASICLLVGDIYLIM